MQTTALYTVAQVRAFDRAAIDTRGIAGYELMQRAAAAAFAHLRTRWPQARRIVALCGSGNNGGDGYVLARLALAAGFDASAIAAEPVRAGGDAARAHAGWIEAGGCTLEPGSSLPEADVYVDALFGTGLTRAPQGGALALIEQVNGAKPPTLALDVPSGVDADTGNVPGSAVHAAATITFVARKRGLFTGAARDHCGEVVLDDLAIPAAVFAGVRADAGPARSRCNRGVAARRVRQMRTKVILDMFWRSAAISGFGGAIRLGRRGRAARRCRTGQRGDEARASSAALNAARPELMASGVGGPQELDALLQRAERDRARSGPRSSAPGAMRCGARRSRPAKPDRARCRRLESPGARFAFAAGRFCVDSAPRRGGAGCSNATRRRIACRSFRRSARD
jgi:NAD(P)H-hydrate epimerase